MSRGGDRPTQRNKSEKLEVIISILRKNLNESWLYFCIAAGVHFQYDSKSHLSQSHTFFGGTFDACLRTSILTLAELFLEGKNSVNFRYLLNMAENHPSLFKNANREDVKESISKHKNWFDTLDSQDISGRLKDIRDKILAHTDRKFAIEQQPGFLSSNPALSLNEAKDMYKQLNEIITVYEHHYHGSFSILGFKNIEMDVNSDIEYLIRFME